MKKLFKPVTIKANRKNNLNFPGKVFVYTEIEIHHRKLVYKGVVFDKLGPKVYVGYKDSTVQVEVLEYYSILFYFLGLINDIWALRSIKKYLKKYEHSNIVPTTYDKLQYGNKLGYVTFCEKSDRGFFSASCTDIVNYLVEHNFKKSIVKNTVQSFALKAYANAKFTAIR